jgi:hypothetical protein
VQIIPDKPNNLKIVVEGVKKISASDEATHDVNQHKK